MRASDFIDTEGVNTHLPYTDGGYANVSNVLSDLNYLGISNVRDSITDGQNGSAPLSTYVTLAQAGVKFTLLSDVGGSVTTASLQSEVNLMAQLQAAVPGSVVAAEGPNEINNFPVTYNGVGGLQGAVDLQEQLYTDVKANPSLASAAVDYFTGYPEGSGNNGPNPDTTPGLANDDTQHPYPNGGQAPAFWVSRSQALGNMPGGSGPAVYTETGYSTNGGTSGAVNDDVQAKYTLDLLMDDAKNGISSTDLYQLMDAYQPGSPQGDDGFGLFNPNNSPKEAATAIHNLNTILADPGATASTFSAPTPSYTVAGLPSTGNSMAIEKSSGASDIVVWAEPQIWNESNGTEVASPTTNVTVQLAATYGTVKVFDPLSSSSPTETLSNVSSVALALTDHPLIVEVEPSAGSTAPTAPTSPADPPPSTPPVVPPPTTPPVVPPPTTPPAAGTDTLDLHVSEDAYQGNAQYTVAVDGTQVGGVRTATASHAAGASQDVSITGNWGSGAHTVAVTFLNDLYGGTPSTDRNLYVNSVSYDGKTPAISSATLLSAGTATFLTPAASTTGTATPISIAMSEDAYKGDAQYTVAIDGKQVETGGSITASNAAGQSQTVNLSALLTAGPHDLAVTFTNDLYGGTPSTDRNLYVKSVDIGTTPVPGAAAALLSTGTTHIPFVVPQP